MQSANKVRFLTTAALVASLSLGVVGCGGKAEEPAETKKEEEPTVEVIVDDTEEEEEAPAPETTSVKLLNGLEQKVTGIELRVAGEEEYGDDLVADDAVVEPNAEFALEKDKLNKDDTLLYDVRLTLEDETTYEFIDVPLANAESVSFKVEDGVAYVDYKLTDGTEDSTKEAATTRKQEQDAAAAAAAAEEEYYEEPVYEEYYEEPVYEEEYYEEPVYEEPAQTEDTCAPDVVYRD